MPTFGMFADGWMVRQHALAHGRVASHQQPGSLRAYLLPSFAARPQDSITREQCDDFRIAAMACGRLNPGTVNNIMELLRLILRAAHRARLIERDPRMPSRAADSHLVSWTRLKT